MRPASQKAQPSGCNPARRPRLIISLRLDEPARRVFSVQGRLTFIATNYDDLSDVARKRTKRKPRQVQAEALVDTGATRLYLQSKVVKALGLRATSEIGSRTMSDRSEKRMVYSPVDLEIQGRRGTFEVIALPDTLPNIIGQIPLEHLDWVIDSRGRKLIPNPEHKHGELADDF